MLSEELIKQVFFYCDHHEPNAVVADDVDIVQFAHRIEQMVAVEYARKEHARCVAIVSRMNQEVANGLDTQRPK